MLSANKMRARRGGECRGSMKTVPLHEALKALHEENVKETGVPIVAIVVPADLRGHTRRTDDTRRTGGDIEVHDDNTETMTLRSVPFALNRLTKPRDHLMQVVITNPHRVIITFIQTVLTHG